jgi:parallel beta-helix repeat protein
MLLWLCYPNAGLIEKNQFNHNSNVFGVLGDESDLNEHTSIIIRGNVDLSEQGFPGTGTEEDPYLICNMTFTANSTCIQITDTNLHFEIRNCTFASPDWTLSSAILLDNVSYGAVRECSVSYYGTAIDIANSSHSLVECNSFKIIEGCTIRLVNCEECIIEENTINETYAGGVCIQNSTNCTISRNRAVDCYGPAVDISRSRNCNIVDNNCTGDFGYFIRQSIDCIIENNTASCCYSPNFGVYSSIDCLLFNNTVVGLPVHGFSLLDSRNCLLANNSVIAREEGISLLDSIECIVADNIMRGAGLRISGRNISCWLHNIFDNEVDGQPIGYFKSQNNVNLTGTQYGEIIVANCSGATIKNGIFNMTPFAVLLGFSENCTLENNTIDGCRNGIYLDNSANCTLRGNTANHGLLNGFTLADSDRCRLTSNTAKGVGIGFEIHSSADCSVERNNVSQSWIGISIRFSNHTNLTGNHIFNCPDYGIYLSDSSCCIMKANKLERATFLITAEDVFGWVHEISDNVIDGRPLGYFYSTGDITVDCSEYAQVIAVNCSNIVLSNGMFDGVATGIQLVLCISSILRNNTVQESNYGLYMLNSHDTIVDNNTIHDAQSVGIIAQQSNSCVFARNVIRESRAGISLYLSMNCILEDNTLFSSSLYVQWADNCRIYRNSLTSGRVHISYSSGCHVMWNSVTGAYWAFSLSFCDGCYISHNVAANGSDGFEVFFSNSTTLYNNTAHDNSIDGFDIRYSHFCTLTENSIINNGRFGIYLGHESSLNTIYMNHIINNTEAQAWDDGESNSWDNGTHGNYWSDYGGEGPYFIPGAADARDNHPLVIDLVVPRLDHPPDQEYEQGTVGHYIRWTPLDAHPRTFRVLRNGSLFSSGSWGGERIVVSVDGLTVGAHNFTLIVYDAGGNTGMDSVWVLVTPGVIRIPEHLRIVVGALLIIATVVLAVIYVKKLAET